MRHALNHLSPQWREGNVSERAAGSALLNWQSIRRIALDLANEFAIFA